MLTHHCIDRLVEANGDSSNIVCGIISCILIKLYQIQVVRLSIHWEISKSIAKLETVIPGVNCYRYLCFAQHLLVGLCYQVYVIYAKVEYRYQCTWRFFHSNKLYCTMSLRWDRSRHTFAMFSISMLPFSILPAFPSNGFLTKMPQRDFSYTWTYLKNSILLHYKLV